MPRVSSSAIPGSARGRSSPGRASERYSGRTKGNADCDECIHAKAHPLPSRLSPRSAYAAPVAPWQRSGPGFRALQVDRRRGLDSCRIAKGGVSRSQSAQKLGVNPSNARPRKRRARSRLFKMTLVMRVGKDLMPRGLSGWGASGLGTAGFMREPLCWERFADDGSVGAGAAGRLRGEWPFRAGSGNGRGCPNGQLLRSRGGHAASGQAVTSRRVIRQAPIRRGSTIQMASEVPACAHWGALMTFAVIWPRARA